ncbi:MAG: ATP-binding cassette subfamily B protein [Halioglobus sp.]|jgi:ATP-binding cassette subfamily B protein
MKFSLLLTYITPHRSTLIGILLLLTVGSLISLANPWMAGLLTASTFGESAVALDIKWLLGLWLMLMVVRSGLGFWTSYSIGNTGERITTGLRSRLYQHMQSLPVGYYQQRRAGETLTLLSTDAEIISGFVTDTVVGLLPALFTFAGAFVMMAWLDWSIALLSVALLPAYFVAMKIIGRKMRPLSRAWVDANSHMFSVMEENLSLLPAIKAFTRERHEQSRFDDANNELLQISRKQVLIEAALSPAMGLLGGVGLVLLLWMGTTHIASGQLEPSQLVTLLLYAMLLMSPLRTLADVYGQVQQTLGSAERIINFLEEKPEPADEGKLESSGFKGEIRFRNVSFAYPNRAPVLTSINLTIAAGETIALTGANGVGKTTISHLLMRFADPQHGEVLIDGLDIREVKLSNLRSQIGLVAQHVLLLNGTIAENIAYAQPDADKDSIEQAARAAHAHAFIAELPEAYNTVIGDQGIRLSGGQRQRLSLARTLMVDPPILILDEATAMFDPAGERAFIDECHSILSQKTVILITHRPASLALADRVLKLSHDGFES